MRSLGANVAEIKAIGSIPALADIPDVTIIIGILDDHARRIVRRIALAVVIHGKTSPIQKKVEGVVQAAGLRAVLIDHAKNGTQLGTVKSQTSGDIIVGRVRPVRVMGGG